MKLTHPAMKNLSRTIFSNVLLFTLGIILVLAGTMTAIYYASYEHDAEKVLAAAAQDTANYLDTLPPSDRPAMMEKQLSGATRYTLIAQDGSVTFDSTADSSQMSNHANRPEIQKAATLGKAVTLRYSETLGSDTVYAAVQLSDGTFVRLSETRHSLLAFLKDMLLPVCITLIAAILFVFLLSKKLTRHIMRPIDALDFSEPRENDIYEEMKPLLIRIDEQQRQLKQQNKELAEAENMRRDFSSNVSHEMKTPLQVISGYAELMKNNMVQPSDCPKFAALIYDEAQAMRSLINDVLTLSKLDESAGSKENSTIDLYNVVHRVAERLFGLAKSRNVKVEVKGVHAFIVGNETLAEEMLYNLVENGIRYNHKEGKVVIAIEKKLSCKEQPTSQKYAVIHVSDTGWGIPSEMHEKIFERFFRIDKSRSKETGGTGLGLAIVKHAVMYHGGTIAVESTEDKGTVFTLTFPLEKEI